MTEHKEEDIVVRVEKGLIWPSVYEPEKMHNIGSTHTYGGKFATSFPATDLQTVMKGLPAWVRIGKDGLVRARSNLRPEVMVNGRAGATDCLVQELARLDARNLPRDKVFDGRRVDVVVRPYDYNTSLIVSGTALVLMSVEVYL